MSETEIPVPFAKREPRPLMVMEMADANQDMDRWAGQAHWELLSQHKGRIVKRMDNALMMEFADARSCLQAAFALGRPADPGNSGSAHPETFLRPRLRAGAHLANYARNGDGAASSDMKLAAELTALAKPGEVLFTAELRDRLADGLDADFEDLGYRQVGTSGAPVRLFQAQPGQAGDPDWASIAHRDVRPGLAVIPFRGSVPEARPWMFGELIAQGVIARLSHSIGIRVISRQSTSLFRDRPGLDLVERHLGVTFVLSGSYHLQGRRLVVKAELSEARSHALLWSGQLQHPVNDLLHEDSSLLHELAQTVAQAMGKAQVRKVMAQSLPRLDSSFLMLGAITMTHSHSTRTFQRGREALAELAGRHPGIALPRAWLGLWHALNVVKGQSGDVRHDTAQAHEQTLRALQAEPGHAMALAVQGYIQCQLLGNPHEAGRCLNAAIEANPSEPMAWLFKSLASGMWGSSSASVAEVCIARSLSPVDPLRYFFDMFMGNALCGDHQQEEAIAYAKRSLRANRHHVPALRLLLTAQAELRRLKDGRATLRLLLAEVPGLTVASYLAMGSTESQMRQRCAKAMRKLGLPEN